MYWISNQQWEIPKIRCCCWANTYRNYFTERTSRGRGNSGPNAIVFSFRCNVTTNFCLEAKNHFIKLNYKMYFQHVSHKSLSAMTMNVFLFWNAKFLDTRYSLNKLFWSFYPKFFNFTTKYICALLIKNGNRSLHENDTRQ